MVKVVKSANWLNQQIGVIILWPLLIVFALDTGEQEFTANSLLKQKLRVWKNKGGEILLRENRFLMNAPWAHSPDSSESRCMGCENSESKDKVSEKYNNYYVPFVWVIFIDCSQQWAKNWRGLFTFLVESRGTSDLNCCPPSRQAFYKRRERTFIFSHMSSKT